MQLICGATVVDGTGGPARRADVAVEGGRVSAVGDLFESRDPSWAIHDADGLVLTPGFVDPHTHFDAQIAWDPDLTPSCWHGVTTVVMGNCGIGVAPILPEHRELIVDTLASVEGMSPEALRAGISWSFETFPEYLSAIESAGVRLNVAAMIGHSPLRLYVMGEAALERRASAQETAHMAHLVREAMDAGACGFSSSRATSHSMVDGRPVPTRMAGLDELDALCRAVGEAGHGVVELAVGPDLSIDDLPALSSRIGRPVTSTGLPTEISMGRGREAVARVSTLGGTYLPQLACRPIVMQVSLADPFPLAMLPAFKEVMALRPDERGRIYADPAWRDRARPEVAAAFQVRWDKITVEESARHRDLLAGPTLDVVAETRGVDPFDLFLDLALEENLGTRFRLVVANDDEIQLGALLADPHVLVGLSDAGAHASQLCDACYSTHLLGHWVRETSTLTLEQAVWRLTGQPASFFGLDDRGRIAPGLCADLVAFDPDAVGVGPIRRVHDLPSGADRLVASSTGVEAVWVNGVAIRRGGADVEGARPGTLVRHR